jgi:hypothetical protein
MAVYSEAPPQIVEIARRLINEHHKDLEEMDIGFLVRDVNGSRRGMPVLSNSQITPQNLRTFIDFDFIIWISEEAWSAYGEEQRIALIDHELSHCTTDDNGAPALRGHDIEEFSIIISRYGLWNPRLYMLDPILAKAKQLILDGVEVTRKGRVEAADPEKVAAVVS